MKPFNILEQESFEEIDEFINGCLYVENDKPFIKTLEGNMFISEKDYVIKGVQGEFYLCKPDIFEETYQREEDFIQSFDILLDPWEDFCTLYVGNKATNIKEKPVIVCNWIHDRVMCWKGNKKIQLKSIGVENRGMGQVYIDILSSMGVEVGKIHFTGDLSKILPRTI